MDLNKYFDLCRNKVESFKERVLPFEYVETGITLTEGFSFCMISDFFEIDMILESGTARGISTEIFGKYFKIPIKSVDITSLYGINTHNNTVNRLSKYKNIECIIGDGLLVLPSLIEKNKDKKIGLFLDGPKGDKAINLSKKCFEYKNVKFVGIHDTCHPSNYHLMDKWEKTVLYSDNPNFNEFKDIDGLASAGGIGFSINK